MAVIDAISVLLKSKKLNKYVIPYVDKAPKDGEGNVITDTYAKIADIPSLTDKANTDFDNVSATGKSTSISWGMPDYSAGVDYANNTTVNTAPSNGVLVISYYVSAVTTGYFKINGQNIASSYHNAAYGTTVTGQYMLSKGDTFQITSVAMASTSIPFICRFYPCKGAN